MHLPDAIDRVRPSIIQIAASIAGDRVVAGTGFLVHSEGHSLTARHVAEAARNAIDEAGGDGRIMAGLAMPELTGPPVTIRASFELVEVVVEEEDPRHDLALLRLDPNPFTSGKPSGVSMTEDGGVGVNGLYGLAPLSLAPPRDGDSVAVSGYPSTPALVTTHGVVASATATDVAEVQPPGAPEGFTIPDVKDSYLIDAAVNPGNSGGPVYSVYEGAVIGVCVAFRIGRAMPEGESPFAYNSGLAVAVPIKYGIELLQRHATL